MPKPYSKIVYEFNTWMRDIVKSKHYWDHDAMLKAYKRLEDGQNILRHRNNWYKTKQAFNRAAFRLD